MVLLSARSSASCWCTYGIHDLPCHRDVLLSCLPLTCVHGCSFFNNIWDKFEAIDTDGDRRLTESEFVAGCKAVELTITEEEAKAEFAKCDDNGGGFVLFNEFCSWCAAHHMGGLDSAEEDRVVATTAEEGVPPS